MSEADIDYNIIVIV